MPLIRFGVSIEKDLLAKFDRLLKQRKYTSRSEAFRDLIRNELICEQWSGNQAVAGAVTLLYNHHKRELVNRLMDIQHDFGDIIISSQHVHLDHDNCLEVITVKGSPRQAQKLAHTLKSVKGVKHGTLSMSATGKGV
ncbi:MAG: nickel-responsive transcriptional regulator NikR [Candidatus Omnitrophota bacterium]|nr:nickel-responsive transcriptional regulator NikR [Candidatus Omnitrophota bacterium]